MATSKIILSISPTSPPKTNPFFLDIDSAISLLSRRSLILTPPLLTLSSSAAALAEPPPPAKPNSFLAGIANTKSWFQFFGDGFAIRVPPEFEDIMEPEDFNAGLSLYGDKAKPKTYAARFSSHDG